jgi:hypothetical protein
MPEAFAQAWKNPDIPKSASLRTLWADDISTKAKALLKATHGRKRCKWRINMSTVVKNMENKRANGVIRAFINSALRRPTKSGLSTELTIEDYIEKNVDISRISALDNTPILPAVLLPSTNVLVFLPLRNITVKGIILRSQPEMTNSTSSTTAIRYAEPYRTRKITDPDEHKKEKAKFMQLWMSNKGKENEQKWTEDSTFADRTLQSPFTMDSRHGRELRECAHRGDDLRSLTLRSDGILH